MQKSIFKVSWLNALYFSSTSFFLVWVSAYLYQLLEKTSARVSLGGVIIGVLALSLIMFALGIANILFGEEALHEQRWLVRFFAILLFIVFSALILGALGFAFWYPL